MQTLFLSYEHTLLLAGTSKLTWLHCLLGLKAFQHAVVHLHALLLLRYIISFMHELYFFLGLHLA